MPLRHANYDTFHEMSVRLDEGGPLGHINLTRLVKHAWDRPYDPYLTSWAENSSFCDYYTLDPGFAYFVHAARHLFQRLPDNFLRTLALQGLVDLLGLLTIYLLLQHWGWLPGLTGGLLFATNPVLSYVVTLAFYYFWDGVMTLIVLATLMAGTLHLQRGTSRLTGRVLLAVMGACLGFGVLLRASWFPYGLVILTTLLLFRLTRRHVWMAAIAFALAASPAIIRASLAEGRFATSTRMAWHTAHQALGKFPNALGLEDDDGYQFELAERVYGVRYNYCSYRAQDEAMRADYKKILNDDPGFVVRSVATRLYENVFWNNNENYFPFWNWGLLSLAVAGGIWLYIQGGQRRILAVVATALFGAACAAIGFVYYINPNYANVTQLCLIVLACGVADGVQRLTERRRGAPAHRPGVAKARAIERVGLERLLAFRHNARRIGRLFRRHTMTIAIAMGLIIAVGGGLLASPVQRYLATPRAPEYWVAPEEVPEDRLDRLVEAFTMLSADDARRFELHVGKTSPDLAGLSPEDAVRQFFATRFHVINGYRVGSSDTFRFPVLVDRSVSAPAFQAVFRSSKFILGWRLTTITGFSFDNPESWNGRMITLSLDPTAAGGADRDRVQRLVEEKFVRRGFVRIGALADSLTYRVEPIVPTGPSN